MRNDGAVLTMSGRVATNPSISASNSDRVSFRVISTERRYDEAAGEWVDGNEFSTTVVGWGKVGVSFLHLVRKGDPVLVDGRLSTRRYEKDGVTGYFTECAADHVAVDVARSTGRIIRDTSRSSELPALAAEVAEATGEEPADTGDPFQRETAPDRELAAVL